MGRFDDAFASLPDEPEVISPLETPTPPTPMDTTVQSRFGDAWKALPPLTATADEGKPLREVVPAEVDVPGTFRIGMQATRERSQWDNDELLRNTLSDVALQFDYRKGAVELAKATGTPVEFVEKNWNKLQRAARLNPDPQKFRKDEPWLYNMVIRNPWAAETVLATKDVTAVSQFLQESLKPGWELAAGPFATMAGLQFRQAKSLVGLATEGVDEGEAREVDVGATEGEEGFYAGAKYFEQLSKGMLSSGVAPLANAIAELPAPYSYLAGPIVGPAYVAADIIKGATGVDARGAIAMPQSDLATLGNRSQNVDKDLYVVEQQLKEEGLSEEEHSRLWRERAELEDKKLVIDKDMLALQRRTRPADWGESAGEALLLDSMTAVTSQVASLTGMGTGAALGAGVGMFFGPGGVAIGARIGGLAGGFVTTTYLERGTSWPEMRDLVDEDGEQVDVPTAAAWNNVTAVIKGLIETGADAFAVTRAMGPAGDLMLRGETRAAMKAAMGNRSVWAAVKDMAARWAGSGVAEGAEEFTQAGVDVVGRWGATGIVPDPDAALQEMIRAGMVGAIGGGLVGSAMVPVHIATQVNEWSKVKRAGAMAAGIEQLSGVEGVREMPVEFAQVMSTMAQDMGRPVEGVFLSPLRLQEVANEKGAQLDVVIEKLLGPDGKATFDAAVAEAKLAPEGATKATLRIDTSSFVKEWAPLNLMSGFAGDITTASGTRTLREEAEQRVVEAERLQETLKEIEREDSAAGGWVPESGAEIQLRKAVEDSLRVTAEKTGALDEDQVNETLRVRRAMARVFAERSQFSQEEILEHLALQFRVAPTNAAPAQLERRIAETEALIENLSEDPTTENKAQLAAAETELAQLERRREELDIAEARANIADPTLVTESALNDVSLDIAERVSDALIEQTTDGPRLDAEVVAPVTLEQVHNFAQWETRTRAWMKEHLYTPQQVEKHIGAIRGQMAIFESLSEVELEFLPRTETAVRSDWTPELLTLYNKHDGDLEAMTAEVDGIEDAARKKKMKDELKKTREAHTADWPAELDAIWKQANGNLTVMHSLVKDVEDKALRKRMVLALRAAESEKTTQGMKSDKTKPSGFGTLRKNADPIYKLSFDLSAMCRKRLEAGATMALIQKRLNEKRRAQGLEPRALAQNEMLALANLFRIAGKEAPCLYCYVESPRQGIAPMVSDAIAITAGEKQLPGSPTGPVQANGLRKAKPGEWSESLRQLALAAIDEFNAADIAKADLPDPTFWVDQQAMQDEKLGAEWAKYPALYNFAKKQVDNAKANKPKDYAEYWGHILKVDQTFIDYTSEHAGFRFFSSSDFQFEHVADLMQAMHDLALRQAHSHAYTKVREYIEIFGKTNQKIQTSLFALTAGVARETADGKWSVFARDEKGSVSDKILHTAESQEDAMEWLDGYTPTGGFRQDTWQGMDWQTAFKFRADRDHVGSVFIATSSAQIRWALDNDEIDFIIPFHASGMKKDLFEQQGYVNFTSTQEETWVDKKKKGDPKKIRMHELGAKDGITDEEMTKQYNALLEERGLVGVFPEFADHSKYAKLKKDYARSDTPFLPVKTFNEDGSDAINTKAASRVLREFFEHKQDPAAHPTMPTTEPDEAIVKQMVDLATEYDANGVDPYDVTQAIVDNMPESAARKLARTQVELADGVVGPTLEQAAPKKKDQTKTTAFKKWFGASKIVDDTGRPKRVYHGTTSDFDVFNRVEGGNLWGAGYYLTADPVTASGYALGTEGGRIAPSGDAGANVMPLYARVKKPFVMLAPLTPATLRAVNKVTGENWNDYAERGTLNRDFRQTLAQNLLGGFEEANDVLRKVGFDGITGETATAGAGETILVFEPTQLKSATGNVGTFDPKSPSVVEQGGTGTPRGYMRPAQKGFKKAFQIFLSKNADVSTPLHEMAHAYFEMLYDMATLPPPKIEMRTVRGKEVYELIDQFTGQAVATFDNAAEADVYAEQYMPTLESKVPPQIKHDYGAILSFIGAKSFKSATTAQHEKFARSFEKYLLEGNAPAVGLISTFARIKAWLFKIYRDGKELDVEIDDAIRGVFDRMLATDDEINLMRASMGIDLPFFATAKQAGMTQAEFTAYKKERDQQLNKSALRAQRLAAEATRDMLSTEWQKELAFNREVARDDYRKRKDYRASQYIRKNIMLDEKGDTVGGPPFDGRLNRDSVVDMVGKNTPVEQSVRRATVKEGGMHPDDVAVIFNYATGKDMLEAVAALPKESTYVREFADELTAEDHPDMKAELARLDEVVGEALHSQGTTEALLREWMLINNKAGRGSMQQLAVERYAADVVARGGVMGLRPADALARERRFAEQSIAAAAVGDFNTAADAKLQQLINHFVYRGLVAAKQERDAGIKLVRKMLSKKVRERLGKAGATETEPRSAYLDVSDAIVEALNASPIAHELPRLGVTDLVAKIELDGGTVAFEPEALNQFLASPRPLQELSMGEFRDLIVALSNIAANARKKNSALLDGKKIAMDEAAALLVAEAEDLPLLGKLSEGRGSPTDWILAQHREWSARLLRQSTMVGWLGGRDTRSAWHRLILQPLRDAEAKKRSIMRETIEPIVDAFETMPAAVRRRLNDKIDTEKLFPTHKAGLLKGPSRRYHLLVMALNTGTQDKENNTGNFERLTEGRNITEEQVTSALKTLTFAEWQWVQSVWDAFGGSATTKGLWTQVRALEMRDSGLAPSRIPLRPFTIETADGKTFTSPGGYVPAVYDRTAATNTNVVLSQGIGSLQDQTHTHPGTSRGHTKARAQNFSDVISLEPGAFKRGLAQTAHDLAFREPIRQVGALLLRKDVQEQLQLHLGAQRTKSFIDWARAVGNDNNDNTASPPTLLTTLRSHSMTAILGHRVKTMIGDAANWFAAAPRLKKYWAHGFRQYYANPGEWKALAEKHSTWLTTARVALDVEFDLMTERMTRRSDPLSKAYHAYKDTAWWGFEQTFKLTAYPMWISAFQMYATEEKMSDKEASRAADDFCAKYFPSTTNTEKSDIQRNKGMLGFSMMFFGYMNSVHQINADAAQEIYQVWSSTKGHHGQKVWNTAKALPAVAGHLIAFWSASMVLGELFTGRGPDDDEGWLEWYGRKLMMGPIAPIPLVGFTIESAIMGKPTSVRAAPGLSTFDDILKAMRKVADAKPDALQAALKAAGLVMGVPVSPLEQLEYLLSEDGFERDLAQGDVFGIAEGVAYGQQKRWSGQTLPGILARD